MTTEQATTALIAMRQQLAVLTQALAEQRRWRDLAALETLCESAALSCRDRARVRSAKTQYSYDEVGG